MSHFDSEAEEDPNIGLVLDGRYRIDETIGAGATGVVYRAMQSNVGRKVAVKLLKKKYSGDGELRARFETEARAVARLSDPHCITLFDFGYDGDADRLYMVFDYVDGQSLEDLLPGPVPAGMALMFVAQIASALKHAHEAGILHRDLKPSNVLLESTSRGERARVVDFGLARICEPGTAGASTRMTLAGQVFGSPAYMAPEQCLGELDVGSPADIYALGCVAFELLEGAIPFGGKSVTQVINGHLHEAVPQITAAGVAPEIASLIRRMMAKHAEERPTAGEVIETIAPLVDMDVSMEMQLGAPTRSGNTRPVFEADLPTQRPKPAPPIAMILIIAIIVAALIGAAFWFATH